MSIHAEVWSIRTNDTIEPIANTLATIGEYAKEFDQDVNWVVNLVNPRGASLDLWYSPGRVDSAQEMLYLKQICNAIAERIAFVDFDIHTD